MRNRARGPFLLPRSVVSRHTIGGKLDDLLIVVMRCLLLAFSLGVVMYELLTGDGLDVDIVERIAPQGVTYTSQRGDAVATVDRGDAEAAFLLRPTRIEDVWEVARRGDTMPQKSTYFFPKLTSGLLFHPLD